MGNVKNHGRGCEKSHDVINVLQEAQHYISKTKLRISINQEQYQFCIFTKNTI